MGACVTNKGFNQTAMIARLIRAITVGTEKSCILQSAQVNSKS